MHKRIALVSCVKSKLSVRACAKDLYTSDLFCKMRAYAERVADSWFILSAEHGLLEPNAVVEPYERTLNRMSKADRVAWAEKVRRQLLQLLPGACEVVVLAGERYRENLVPFLHEQGFTVTVPMEGLSFGRQLQFLGRSEDANLPTVTREIPCED